jgi:hypothetical protein
MQSAIRPDFLLLDLRIHGPNRIKIWREAGSAGVPLVILTPANLDAEFSEFCDRCGAWRLTSPPSETAVHALSAIFFGGSMTLAAHRS